MSYKNILYVSQFRDSSGYASAARSYVKAVDTYLQASKDNINFKIYTIPIEHTNSLSVFEKQLLSKYELKEEDIDTFIRNEYTIIWHMPSTMPLVAPNFVQANVWNNVMKLLINSAKNINMTVWEASSIPSWWKDKVYDPLGVDSLIVPSVWNKEVFTSCFPDIDCNLLPHVIETNNSEKVETSIHSKLKNKFVIFTMSQWQSRKGFDKLIQSYCMEFKDQKDVVLVIKTYGNLMNTNSTSVKEQATEIANQIRSYKEQVVLPDGKQCTAEIILLPYVLPFSQISALQERADLFALLTRAEGFGLTIAEAVGHGTPVMVPDQGGHIDYLDSDNTFFVQGHWSPYLGKAEYNSDMNWYEPHILSARKNLREAYNLWKKNKLANIGLKSKQNLEKKHFDKISIGRLFIETIKSRNPDITLPNINLNDNVNSKTLKLKNNCNMLGIDYKSKIKMLKDSFKGEDCYILTCGPSIKEYDFDYLKEKLKDKLVFTIKQSIDDFESISNFHFFNSNNFSKFNNNSCISIGSSAEFKYAMENSVWKDQKYDIFLKILQDKDYTKTVAKSNSFDKWLLEDTIKRPWGPGIMYETVLHFAYHLGVSNIYTLGWDLEKPGTLKSSHYYDKTIKQIIRPADIMNSQEIVDNITASLKVAAWLKNKNVNLYVATENSYVHESVERKKI